MFLLFSQTGVWIGLSVSYVPLLLLYKDIYTFSIYRILIIWVDFIVSLCCSYLEFFKSGVLGKNFFYLLSGRSIPTSFLSPHLSIVGFLKVTRDSSEFIPRLWFVDTFRNNISSYVNSNCYITIVTLIVFNSPSPYHPFQH